MRPRRHDQRPDLAGEHRIGDAGQIFFACLFLSVWLIDTFFLQYTTFLNGYVSLFLRLPVGVILLIIAGYLSQTGLAIVFGEERKKPEVIRKGVFGLVRHPIYLGELLFYLGLLIFSLSLSAAGVWFLTIIFLHYIARYEEKLLVNRFEDKYKKYMKEVPMWIPHLSLLSYTKKRSNVS
jgi:protein-S-isoprenylcysteine O-methyltransferase Ste14